MDKKRYIVFSLILSFGLILGMWQYLKTFDAVFALAVNPGHSWGLMECNSNICVDTSTNKLGIGTISPETNLHVVGGFKVGSHTNCDSSTGAWTFSSAFSVLEPTADSHVATKGYTDSLMEYVESFLDCSEGVTDIRDGNWYPAILIGDQCWMAKNLAYLPYVYAPTTYSDVNPYYYVYGYSGTNVGAARATQNYNIYGVLYNWKAATTACPSGWHLPTDAEQYTLENYLSTGECLASRTSWSCDPAGALLKEGGGSGFNAQKGGMVGSGSFRNLGSYGYFWSATSYPYLRIIGSNTTVYRDGQAPRIGFSVRCVKD